MNRGDVKRVFLLLSALALLSLSVLAQSGRKGASPKPATLPSPSPEADKLLPAKSTEPPLPEVVDGERIYKSRETDERYEILKKPLPSYTYEARRHQTRGTVRLRLILAADETVKHIEVVHGLPDGLNEKAIQAAKQIKFKPAKNGGKPVSVWVEVEYGFQLY